MKESLKVDNFNDKIAENSLSVPLKEARENLKGVFNYSIKKINKDFKNSKLCWYGKKCIA